MDRVGGQKKKWTYRADGQVTAFELDGANGNALVSVSYFFDPLGRRVAKQITQGGTQYVQSYTFLSDGHRVLVGQAGNSGLTLYFDGDGELEHLGEQGSGGVINYVTDHLGSVLNNGVAGSGFEFGAFGEFSANTASLSVTGSPLYYGFSGFQIDLESSLYLDRGDPYSPVLGRFFRRNSPGRPPGRNPFEFRANDPLRADLMRDLSGLNLDLVSVSPKSRTRGE